jgi:large subunit ribosomal protein L4
MNVMAKRVAMLSALSQKIRENDVIFVDELKSENGKTKDVVNMLKAFDLNKTVLFVMDNSDVNVLRACANIQAVSTIPADQINTYDIVKNAKVVITAKAIKNIEEAYEG